MYHACRLCECLPVDLICVTLVEPVAAPPDVAPLVFLREIFCSGVMYTRPIRASKPTQEGRLSAAPLMPTACALVELVRVHGRVHASPLTSITHGAFPLQLPKGLPAV